MDPQGIKWVGSGARPETIGLFGSTPASTLVLHSKSIFGQVNLCKVLILNTCRCGEMADATDLKSVGLQKARAGSSPAIGTSSCGLRKANRHDQLDLAGFSFP